MRITLHFMSNGREVPSAVTGVEGDVTDLSLPATGDYVEHRDLLGNVILGEVTRRSFRYRLSDGEDSSGEVAVIIWPDEVKFSDKPDDQQRQSEADGEFQEDPG